ncbi:hypothetical protein [Streptomyces sp. B29(2018)]|uniref:hypothetical protein n=1 Tax=Streptomyces sp. B29(2018) TaxID=2485016 RepID=UPI000FD6399A|nr:hypothetical protein [Streptomyces sp. B29(2018)]
MLDALGIRNSPAHTEVMLTATGLVLIETGARLGGATSPAVVEQHCGMSQTALAAAALATPKDFDDLPTTTSPGPVLCATRSSSTTAPATPTGPP